MWPVVSPNLNLLEFSDQVDRLYQDCRLMGVDIRRAEEILTEELEGSTRIPKRKPIDCIYLARKRLTAEAM